VDVICRYNLLLVGQYPSIMMSVCPASNGKQAITRIGH